MIASYEQSYQLNGIKFPTNFKTTYKAVYIAVYVKNLTLSLCIKKHLLKGVGLLPTLALPRSGQRVHLSFRAPVTWLLYTYLLKKALDKSRACTNLYRGGPELVRSSNLP